MSEATEVQQLKRLADATVREATAIERFVERFIGKGDPCGDQLGHTSIRVIAVGFVQKETTMGDHSPKFVIHSSKNYGVLAVTGPKKADGTYAATGAWSSVDDPATAPPDGSAQLTLEPLADAVAMDEATGQPAVDAAGLQIPVYSVKVNTPLEMDVVAALPGAKAGGTVTWKSAGMADCDIPVEYSDPALGHTVITGSELPE